MQTIQFEVSGMSCGSCVKHVEAAVKEVEGVASVIVDLAKAQATVTIDQAGKEADIVAHLEDAGYPAKLIGLISEVKASSESNEKSCGGGCCCH